MSRTLGTVVRGIRTPIVKEGDDVVQIVFDSLKEALESENITLRDKDVIGITESLIAKRRNCILQNIFEDVNSKFKGRIGVVFPIISK